MHRRTCKVALLVTLRFVFERTVLVSEAASGLGKHEMQEWKPEKIFDANAPPFSENLQAIFAGRQISLFYSWPLRSGKLFRTFTQYLAYSVMQIPQHRVIATLL
jgi:hypothetical protein